MIDPGASPSRLQGANGVVNSAAGTAAAVDAPAGKDACPGANPLDSIPRSPSGHLDFTAVTGVCAVCGAPAPAALCADCLASGAWRDILPPARPRRRRPGSTYPVPVHGCVYR